MLRTHRRGIIAYPFCDVPRVLVQPLPAASRNRNSSQPQKLHDRRLPFLLLTPELFHQRPKRLWIHHPLRNLPTPQKLPNRGVPASLPRLLQVLSLAECYEPPRFQNPFVHLSPLPHAQNLAFLPMHNLSPHTSLRNRKLNPPGPHPHPFFVFFIFFVVPSLSPPIEDMKSKIALSRPCSPASLLCALRVLCRFSPLQNSKSAIPLYPVKKSLFSICIDKRLHS